MEPSKNYRVSIKGIEFDDAGRILLSKESNGMWELLGGGLHHGEEPKTCLRREVLEETGLKIKHISADPIHFVTSAGAIDPSKYFAFVIYEIKLEHYNFSPSDECQELRFFSLEEMNEVKLFPNVHNLKTMLETRK